jgi:hypothetical protein
MAAGKTDEAAHTTVGAINSSAHNQKVLTHLCMATSYGTRRNDLLEGPGIVFIPGDSPLDHYSMRKRNI